MVEDVKRPSASLEDRITALEETAARIIAFDQTVKTTLTHILDRFKAFEEVGKQAAQTQYLADIMRVTDALSRASKIYPKTRTVIFVGKGYFGDNVKYAFLAFLAHAKRHQVAAYFLAETDAQYDLLMRINLPAIPARPESWTQAHIKALLSAKVSVLNDNFHAYAKGSPKAFAMLQASKSVQLWHGIPMKDVGMRFLVNGNNVLLEDLIASCGPFDTFVGTAQSEEPAWAEMFAFGHYAALGHPRNDVFFRPVETTDLLAVDLEAYALFETAFNAGRPTILYAPTYRDDQGQKWFEKIDIAALSEHAKNKGYAFVVNLHPLEHYLIERFRATYPHLQFMSAGTDIYPVTKFASILITDYSSLAFDYLLLNRPLIFFRPDHENYLKTSRGFIEGRLEMTPGPLTDQMGGLIKVLDETVANLSSPGNDPFKRDREQLCARFFDNRDGGASQRVSQLLLQMVDEDEGQRP